MSNASADPDPVTITFHRPRFFQSPLLLRLISAAVFVPVGLLAVFGPNGWRVIPLILFGFLACIVLVLAIRLWRPPDLPPIVVKPDAMTLPLNLEWRHTVEVPLADLRSATVLGSRRFARLVIDAGRRQFVFPLHLFAEADAVDRLHDALRAGVTARPNGDALWRSIAARNDIAAELRHVRPYATWCAVLVLAVAFAVQTLAQSRDPLSLLRLGANAPVLVWRGEWFRLITANLLHATPYHLLANAGALLLYGTFVERLAGARRAVLVLLTTGILSHAISASVGAELQRHLFSVGTSGAVFGLLGALGAIIWRFGVAIPGGLRPPGPAWWIFLIGYAVAVAAVVPQIDSAAQAGGALAGLVLGALVCGTCADARALRRPGPLVSLAAYAMVAVWLCGLVAGVLHAASPASRIADETLLAEGTLGFPPPLQNDVAWDIAVDPAAGPEQLHRALELATRAVVTTTRLSPDDVTLAAYTDTEAALDYRLGEAGRAMRIELPLIGKGAAFAGHFAVFLDRALREDGIQIFGEVGPAAPSIVLAGGVFHLVMPDAAPSGARVYAVLRRHDVLAGTLLVLIPPNFSGLQVLPLPTAFTAPATAAPPALWTEPDADIRVALFDRRGCGCKIPTMGPWFYPAGPGKDLPPWTR